MTLTTIAIIGMACHYPGAQDLRSFWENILTRRRQFRSFPDSRFPLAEYYDPDPAAPDKTYCPKAGLLDGFSFDPVRYRVPRTTFDSADIVHWLALKVALASLEDAGLSKENIPKERTGVILGNTLTGEHSRAEGLRLRWPFVRRVVEKAALEKDLSLEQTTELLVTVKDYYKSVFTPMTEDTLAGALSNTIAGRICNYLDLHGGGYVVDGACSSSIIAAATAANHLVSGDLDLAIAGGVDISLDTFEMIGFAKTAALTTEDMRVYDRRANGFIPGEGCGMVVMKRLEDAVADGDYVYAVLHGWGISSDGKGGLTAPNARGQATALQRAYERAEWDIRDLDFIEGHGTGTAVGDRIELEGVALAMSQDENNTTEKETEEKEEREAERPRLRRCGMTSLKSLIGHTKAASGVGALIKTVIALNQRILPPLANCFDPNPIFAEKATMLYPLIHGEIRSPKETLRAGASGMGFGGINSHLALASGDAPSPKLMPAVPEQKLLADYQDTELFVVSAPTVEELLKRVQDAESLARNICEGERLDLAAHLTTLYGYTESSGSVRAAITAESPERLLQALGETSRLLRTAPPEKQQVFFDARSGICIGHAVDKHRVGFLFPGQGSQKLNMGCQLVQRHDWAGKMVQEMEQVLDWPAGQQLSDLIFRSVERALNADQVSQWQEQLKQTEIAQPALCLASMLWLEQLTRLGIQAEAVGGHSLGELTAFYAAGACSGEELIRFAALRGQAMAPGKGQAGTMASLLCSAEQAQAILDAGQGYAVVANKNSPTQTVISGDPACIEQACAAAHEQGIRAIPLPVANAFHSRFVEHAGQVLADSQLLPEQPTQLTTRLFSGLHQGCITQDCELRNHFSEQVVSPVDFIGLVQEMSTNCDLLLEVGSGRVLTGLSQAIIEESKEKKQLCFSTEAKPGQDREMNLFLANYFIRGGKINWHALYEDRFIRPFTPYDERVFLTNPCERPLSAAKSEANETGFSGLTTPVDIKKGLSATDHLLAKYAGISQQDLASYLGQRGQFLGGIIRVDIDTMASMGGCAPFVALESVQPGLFSSKSFPEPITPSSLSRAPKEKNEHVDRKGGGEKKSSIALLVDLIEERTGFPPESLSLDLRLLDDLNLDSIKASELIGEAANRAGVAAAKLNVAEYANATLEEVAALLDNKPEQQQEEKDADSVGYPGWARDFTQQYLPEPLLQDISEEVLENRKEENSWDQEKVLILSEVTEQQLADQLCLTLQQFSAKVEAVSFAEARQKNASLLHGFTCVIALLPEQGENNALDVQSLTEQVTRLHTVFSPAYHQTDHQTDNSSTAGPLLAAVQIGDGFFHDGPLVTRSSQYSAKALAASFHLEQPDVKVRALHFSSQIGIAQLCEYIMLEISTPESYAAVGYGADQLRRVPRVVLRNRSLDEPRPLQWSAQDVVLATGGAKGITAECVLAFARATGVQLALVGSSSPAMRNEQHDAILRTLKRANKDGLTAHYYQCDITDGDAVKRLVRQVENEQGTITGVIHGSALNRPAELSTVSVDQALEEIGPKIIGAMNLCTALKDNPPRLFIAFSSLVGITGMRQNGWYGFSNEALHLFLRQYGSTEPRTATLSIAFSIWDEVGMGIRMGSTSWLRTIGVEPLSVEQGTSCFLRFVTHDPDADQVLVTARTAGLDTFVAHGPPLPKGLRFIDRVNNFQPGVEIICRTRLTLEDDPYIKDHCWRGTYLFPMVFGLEAMAQAVRAVTGITCFDAVSIEDIELARPIIVSEENGAEIEIHALVPEQGNSEAVPQVEVQIRTEQTDFGIDHFSAVFVLRNKEDENLSLQHDVPEQLAPLDLFPEDDLYNGRVLFQGPLYQKIGQVFELDSKTCLFSIKASGDSPKGAEEKRMLGNPFFRDTLLQSGQIPIPRDLCLPRYIQRIERFPAECKDDEDEELILGKIVIEEHEREYVSSSVTVFTTKGQVRERLTGYRARIIDHKKENPTAEELALPGQRDQEILLAELKKRESILPVHCTLPEFSSCFLPCLQHMKKEERRRKELPFIKKALMPLLDDEDGRIEISWSQEGKPFLAIPADAGIHFSLTHNEGTIICSAGQGVQGCDLESIVDRSIEEWQGLLGEGSKAVLTSLLEQGDSLQWAGTRLWSSFECIFKALEVRPDASLLRLIEKKGDTVLFIYDGCCVLTFPVQLTLRAERMLAVVVPEKIRQGSLVEQVSISGTTDVGLSTVGSITHEFTTTFLEGRGARGKVYFTNIPIWMGELRELALLPIAEPLVQDMKSGQWGMVTNISSFTVDQQLDSYDTVVGEVRLLEDTDLSRSFLSLAFNWFKKQSDGSLIRAVSGKLATTWVKVEGHGKVKQHSLPEYFTAYLEKLSRSPDYTKVAKKERHLFFSKASSLFTATVSTRKQYLLFRQQFLTSREDSNLVGNIYFSNYYTWQARVRDQYFAISLSVLSTKELAGDFVCAHAEVHHLQEAMPFEIIEVSVYLYEVFAEGLTLYFEYHSVSEHGVRLRKLAYGEQTALWVPMGQELKNESSFTEMPGEYLTHFMEKVDKS
jgi:acyl transferase domain-containing protein/acyl-CoA thioesterase FadM/acyl carrier protein